MGALTLLLGLHLAVLSAHAAVRFTLELLREDDIVLEAAAQSSSSSSSGSSRMSGGVRIIDRSIAAHSSSSQSDSTSLPQPHTSREREALGGGGGDIDRQGGKETRQCPLCMESMMHPSAPPCGHLFCWECLHTWISSNSNSSSSSNSITGSNSCTVKCPVCRSLFKQQTVRALHGFS